MGISINIYVAPSADEMDYVSPRVGIKFNITPTLQLIIVVNNTNHLVKDKSRSQLV